MADRIGVLIPHYNNGAVIGQVLQGLSPLGLPTLIIDDGSGEPWRDEARAQAQKYGAEFLTREKNGGKGAAIQSGLSAILERGWTHALCLDADNQHETSDALLFLSACREHPEALILGAPIFGADVPRSRLLGRQISRFWVWVETLSFAIQDPLCGYRLYPLKPLASLAANGGLAERMDFDPQIAVRLVWAGLPVINVPAHVHYPPGGVSHFRLWRDNVRISIMHTFLCLGMLWRLPGWLARRGRW
jgi:glycosyltransferase involved in cell wall biosynthesis